MGLPNLIEAISGIVRLTEDYAEQYWMYAIGIVVLLFFVVIFLIAKGSV